METKNELKEALTRLTFALRQQRAILGAGWGLIAVLGALIAATLASRLAPLWYRSDLLLMLVWGTVAGVLGGLVIGYLWPLPYPQRLRTFDKRLDLADRLTTAWELANGHITASQELAQSQRQEAIEVLDARDLSTAFSLRLPRTMNLALLGLLVALLPALLLPNTQEQLLLEREAQRKAAEEAAQQLVRIYEEFQKEPTLSDAEKEAALEALEAALEALQDPDSTPEEQQLALTEAERQLAALQQPGEQSRIQNLSQAAPLSSEEIVQPLAEALERGDLEAAANYLRAVTDPANGRLLTPEEVEALADALDQIADALQNSDPELAAQFRKITQEMRSGDVQSALNALNETADTLSEIAESNASNESLEQAQAGVQQAQQQLREGTTGSPGSEMAGSQQPGNTGDAQGQPSGNAGQQQGSGAQGPGQTGHSEDSGSGVPYGDETQERLEGEGETITLPRERRESPNRPEVGLPNDARVPYREVYGAYADAAEAELSRTAYPPALRSYIREYFSALEE